MFNSYKLRLFLVLSIMLFSFSLPAKSDYKKYYLIPSFAASEYTINPDYQISGYEETNASIFLPAIAAGYLINDSFMIEYEYVLYLGSLFSFGITDSTDLEESS